MDTFDMQHVKNVALLGHTGSGKTTLLEAMLWESGILSRRGTVEDHNTVGDANEMEQEKGKTLFSKVINTKWRGYKINFMDTPGSDDLAGEIVTSMKVADCGLLLLNAKMGVEVLSDIVWQYAEDFELPLILAVNQLDHEQADFDKTVAEAKNHFGNQVVVVQYPVNQGTNFNGIVDVLHMVYYQFPANGGKPEKLPIPVAEKEKAEELHRILVETIAANQEDLMELYFENGTLTEEQMKSGLHLSLVKHEIFPVFCVSAKNNMGTGRLMGFIDHIAPSAFERPKKRTVNGDTIICSDQGPTVLFVFKTLSEAHVGELSFFKVISGKVKVGDELVNENTGQVERIAQLYEMQGNKKTAVNELVAGDIGATQKLKNTHTNNTLHAKEFPVQLRAISFPTPIYSVAVEGLVKGEEDKLANALHQLAEEDASVKIEVHPELKQTIIHAMGELHLQVLQWKLEHYRNLKVAFYPPKIAYRETIRQLAETTYRHKKQTGGAGQFAEVLMRIEPWEEGMPEPIGVSIRGKDTIVLPWGGKLMYYNCVVGGAIDQRFHASIQKGVLEKMENGPLSGSFVRDVRVMVLDGKMHAVDSNDLAFKTAGMMAFKECFLQAKPQLLEPWNALKITTPEEMTGTIMGTLSSYRAVVEGMESKGHFSVIQATIPEVNQMDFLKEVKSLTQGRAKIEAAFHHYDVVPYEIEQKLLHEIKEVATTT